jgi:hypothetical protein
MRANIFARLGIQVLYIGPLFWFMELLQNLFFRAVQGTWGWTYPPAQPPHDWYSFKSLGLWGVSVAVFWLLETGLFRPRATPFWARMLIAGTIGWAGEWAAGATAHLLGWHMQEWTDAPLHWVKLVALPFWWSDFAVFHLLSAHLRDPGEPANAQRIAA